MSDLPTKEAFASYYAGQAPSDLGRPQPAFVGATDQIVGAVLDVSCGTGDNALFLAFALQSSR